MGQAESIMAIAQAINDLTDEIRILRRLLQDVVDPTVGNWAGYIRTKSIE